MANKMRSPSPKAPLTPEQIIRLRRLKLQEANTVTGFLKKLLLFLAVILLLFTVFFGVKPMVGNDMKPSFHTGDLLLYYRLTREYRAGDVVVYTANGAQYVGRIAAVGGDTVEITEQSTVKINGSTVMEADIYYQTPRYGDEVLYPVTLANGEVFILCDFRDGGKDSRYFGAVPLTRVKGQVIAALRRSQL